MSLAAVRHFHAKASPWEIDHLSEEEAWMWLCGALKVPIFHTWWYFNSDLILSIQLQTFHVFNSVHGMGWVLHAHANSEGWNMCNWLAFKKKQIISHHKTKSCRKEYAVWNLRGTSPLRIVCRQRAECKLHLRTGLSCSRCPDGVRLQGVSGCCSRSRAAVQRPTHLVKPHAVLLSAAKETSFVFFYICFPFAPGTVEFHLCCASVTLHSTSLYSTLKAENFIAIMQLSYLCTINISLCICTQEQGSTLLCKHFLFAWHLYLVQCPFMQRR